MISKIFLGLMIVILIFIVVVSMRPDEFKITRSTTINAPVDVVFAQVNNFHNWQSWSPWAKLDPNAKATFEGPTSGVGAKFIWAGNKDVGEGSETILENRPNELIKINLEFIKPFQANNTAEFTFKSESNQTVVNWSMSGKNNFMSKAVGLVMNCDKMVGGQFEEGLKNLKTISERIDKGVI